MKRGTALTKEYLKGCLQEYFEPKFKNIDERFERIERTFATKKHLDKNFATKEYLNRNFATREYLDKNFATKEYLNRNFATREYLDKNFATKEYLNKNFATKEYIDKNFATREYLDKNFVTKDHFDKTIKDLRGMLHESLTISMDNMKEHYEQRTERYMGALLEGVREENRAARENMQILNEKWVDHEGRISKLEGVLV